MSANRDKDQKYGFFYQNLYQLYRAEKGAKGDVARDEANLEAVHQAGPVVLKVGEARPAATQEFKRDPSFESLRDNLKRLTELHGKLRFMLEELEDLAKDPKKA